MSRVYKILERQVWNDAVAAGRFDGSPVDVSDGFIHFSTAAQAQETARRHFANQSDLVIVGFDAAALGPALRWETSRGGALFPHLYAALDPGLANDLQPAPLDADGIPRIGDLLP